MNKYVVSSIHKKSNALSSPIIEEKNGHRVFPFITLMLDNCRNKFSLDRKIAQIKLYPNNDGFRDGQDGEELDLIDDQIIRAHNGNPEVLEFFNDNIEDPPIEIISKKDFIDLLEQWKALLAKNKS
jgi:hypothetical protein